MKNKFNYPLDFVSLNRDLSPAPIFIITPSFHLPHTHTSTFSLILSLSLSLHEYFLTLLSKLIITQISTFFCEASSSNFAYVIISFSFSFSCCIIDLRLSVIIIITSSSCYENSVTNN